MESEYVIDFERVNELTAHPNDNPSNGGTFGVTTLYSHTRKIIKIYLDIYLSGPKRASSIEYDNAVDTLKYNRILLSKADIRDGKINKVLN